MSPPDDQIPEHEGDDLLAAEYVLGVLPLDEREAAARRIESDSAFARRVDGWETRLAPLADAYADAVPPANAKQLIDRRLFADTVSADTSVRTGGFWSSLALWRGLTAAAIIALLLAVAIPYIGGPAPDGRQERLVASLANDGSDVRYLVVYDATRGEIGLSHVAGERGQGRDFELWVIEGQNAPKSLGVIPAGGNVQVAVAPALMREIGPGAIFAISLEPTGGSPTGAPTGPVVAAGDLRRI